MKSIEARTALVNELTIYRLLEARLYLGLLQSPDYLNYGILDLHFRDQGIPKSIMNLWLALYEFMGKTLPGQTHKGKNRPRDHGRPHAAVLPAGVAATGGHS